MKTVSKPEKAVVFYWGIIAAALASYTFTFLFFYGIFVDKLMKDSSGQIVLLFLFIISFTMWFWLYHQVKMYRREIGPLFPSNPGEQSNQYQDWKDMKYDLVFGILLTITSLPHVFFLPEWLPSMVGFLLGSLLFFFPAGKSARRVTFQNSDVE